MRGSATTKCSFFSNNLVGKMKFRCIDLLRLGCISLVVLPMILLPLAQAKHGGSLLHDQTPSSNLARKLLAVATTSDGRPSVCNGASHIPVPDWRWDWRNVVVLVLLAGNSMISGATGQGGTAIIIPVFSAPFLLAFSELPRTQHMPQHIAAPRRMSVVSCASNRRQSAISRMSPLPPPPLPLLLLLLLLLLVCSNPACCANR
jgi:hypothetical protein